MRPWERGRPARSGPKAHDCPCGRMVNLLSAAGRYDTRVPRIESSVVHDDEIPAPCATAGAESLTVAGFRGRDGSEFRRVVPAKAGIHTACIVPPKDEQAPCNPGSPLPWRHVAP